MVEIKRGIEDMEKELGVIEDEGEIERSAHDTRRKMVIKKHKETYYREPTEAEIETDMKFLYNCMRRLRCE